MHGAIMMVLLSTPGLYVHAEHCDLEGVGFITAGRLLVCVRSA